MIVINKWNGKQYRVLENTGSKVTLERSDGSVFSIQESEFRFNYRSAKDE